MATASFVQPGVRRSMLRVLRVHAVPQVQFSA